MKFKQFSLAAVSAAVVASFALSACGGGGGSSGTPANGGGGTTVAKPNPVTTAPTTSCSTAGVAAASASTATNVVCMLTSDGEIVVELYGDKAPITVANFMKYVDDGFYSNTIFHRVVRGFVVQGGGFTTGLVAKTATYPAITLETNVGLSNTRGTIAMARTSVANSATSQFYFNTVDNSASLDYTSASNPGYAVYGKVISGLTVVDKINDEVQLTGVADTPATEVLLYWAKRIK
ncbi:peptidylprolyl isomerase [Burkholderiaceae bacterium UC74_6]